MALETPSRPPPFMANAILNFHFDYRHPSLNVKYGTFVANVAKLNTCATRIILDRIRCEKAPRVVKAWICFTWTYKFFCDAS